MRMGYFADGPLFRDQNGNTFTVSYNDKWVSRYTAICDEIELCIRVNHQKNTEGLSQITATNVYFKEIPNLSTIGYIWKYSGAKKSIEEVINRCDLIFIKMPSTIGGIAIESCKRMNRPYLVEMVGCPWDSLWNHSWKGKLLAGYSALNTKLKLRNAPAVLYVTNEFLQRRYPTNGLQIGCSDVDFPEVSDVVLENRLEKIKRSNGKLILGTTAAINVPYKGQQYIIETLGRLKKIGITNLEYQLVGTGDSSYIQHEARKCNVEDQVIIKGGLPHEEVFSWLDSIDIYIQPSKQEGLPRALIEAMSRGLPSIGANTGGIPELLDDSCIFKKGIGYQQRIMDILLSFDQDKMIDQAKKNYEKAGEYRKDVLAAKRTKFYRDFFTINRSLR